MKDPVSRTAEKVFGVKYLFPWQRLVIANILDAVDAVDAVEEADALESAEEADDALYDEDGAQRGRQIILLPTGAGKSLCFQIPSLLLKGPTLVIYPLLALMGDQIRSLRANGLDPVLLRGGQSAEEREAQFLRMEGRDGKARASLIIANPEVLAGKGVLERIKAVKISHLAIDEAHCVSEWGDTFRPSYLELEGLIQTLDPPAVTAFTATASDAVLQRIAEVLFAGRAHLVRGETDRMNIRYSVCHCRAKDAALIRETAKRSRPMVIFCATRGGTERTAALLRNTFSDADIRFYHAGLQKNEKTEVESWFHGHERAILCTTCAWGMGVDKKNVRTVIHRDAPPSAESYTQEAGRGGRDGDLSEAVLLWSPSDKRRLEKLQGLQKERARVLSRIAESGRCRREVLLEALGEIRATDEAPGGQKIACSLCDICEGTAVQEAVDEKIVLEYIAGNKRRFSREQIVSALHEAGNRRTGEEGYRGWNRAEFEGIMKELEGEGLLREIKEWPWKGKMTISGLSGISFLPRPSPLLPHPRPSHPHPFWVRARELP